MGDKGDTDTDADAEDDDLLHIPDAGGRFDGTGCGVLAAVALVLVLVAGYLVRDLGRERPPSDEIAGSLWREKCVDDEAGAAAASGKTAEVILALTEGPGAPGAQSAMGERLLLCAYIAKKYDTAAALLRAGVPARDAVDLELPIRSDDELGVRALVEAGVAPTPGLEYAVTRSHYRMAALLLDLGADKGNPALVALVRELSGGLNSPIPDLSVRTNDDGLRLLLDHGADPNASGDDFSPLAYAAYWGKAGAADILLAHGADPDNGGRGDAGMVAFMTASLGDPSGRAVPLDLLPTTPPGRLSMPPLLAAIAQGHPTIVEKLLAAGADPDLAGDGGFVPIYAAAVLGQDRVVTALLAAGANRTPQLPPGLPTPAEAAARARHPTTAALLAS